VGRCPHADGTIVPIQPMIFRFRRPDGIEVLARIAGETNCRSLFAGLCDDHRAGRSQRGKSIRKFLHDGLLEGSAYPVR